MAPFYKEGGPSFILYVVSALISLEFMHTFSNFQLLSCARWPLSSFLGVAPFCKEGGSSLGGLKFHLDCEKPTNACMNLCLFLYFYFYREDGKAGTTIAGMTMLKPQSPDEVLNLLR